MNTLDPLHFTLSSNLHQFEDNNVQRLINLKDFKLLDRNFSETKFIREVPDFMMKDNEISSSQLDTN